MTHKQAIIQFSRRPVLLSGIIKPDENPHPAEIIPEASKRLGLAMNFRQDTIQQLLKAIKSGESVVIIGLPGIGKTTLIETLMKQAFGHYPLKWKKDRAHILDDTTIEPSSNWFKEIIRANKQMIIVNPPAREKTIMEALMKLKSSQAYLFRVFILPPPGQEGFNAFMLKHINTPISERVMGIIFSLCGGNYRVFIALANYLNLEHSAALKEKIFNGSNLTDAETKSLMFNIERRANSMFSCLGVIAGNFRDDINFIKSNFIDQEFPAGSLISLPSEDQERVFRLLQYGLLVIDDDKIIVNGRLLKERIRIFNNPIYTRLFDPIY